MWQDFETHSHLSCILWYLYIFIMSQLVPIIYLKHILSTHGMGSAQ